MRNKKKTTGNKLVANGNTQLKIYLNQRLLMHRHINGDISIGKRTQLWKHKNHYRHTNKNHNRTTLKHKADNLNCRNSQLLKIQNKHNIKQPRTLHLFSRQLKNTKSKHFALSFCLNAEEKIWKP